MGRILRVGLMVLLVAAAGVGNVWGKWETWGAWQYDQIDETTCRIQIPESQRSSISGSVTIPPRVGIPSLTVVEIAPYAFNGCSALEEVIIPGSVTTIGARAFYGCGLKQVTIPSNVETIGEFAFCVCKELKDVLITSSVKTIGMNAFAGCKMKGVTIPEGVETIGKFAFSGCIELKEVTIPSSVKTIGEGAFCYCNQLTEFKVGEGNANYCAVDGVLFTENRQILIAYPGGRKGAYTPPYWCYVYSIDSSAFRGCDGLTAVEIPSYVEWIEPNAFADCKSLNTVYMYQSDYQEFTVDWTAFKGIGNSATLYVRLGVKGQIEDEPWCTTDNFTNIVEFCVVTLDAKGGTPTPDAQMVVKDDKATEPTAPTREGYTFVEWQLDGKKYDFSTKVTKDITLVAVWKENTYTVTFDAKGGTPAPNAQTVKEGKAATAPTAPTKKGYTFVEWQLDGAKYDFSTPVTKDITLVAVWKQNFTVTFDANGGTPTPDAQTVVKDGTATEPTAPTKEGYTFAGWQLDGKKYDFSKPVTQDIKLVAVWKKNEESTPDNPETAVESVQLAAVRVVRNPVGEALELEGMERAARVEVYSVVGARVHAEALYGEPRVVIDAQGWASGVYVVRVVASDGERTLRVVK